MWGKPSLSDRAKRSCGEHLFDLLFPKYLSNYLSNCNSLCLEFKPCDDRQASVSLASTCCYTSLSVASRWCLWYGVGNAIASLPYLFNSKLYQFHQLEILMSCLCNCNTVQIIVRKCSDYHAKKLKLCDKQTADIRSRSSLCSTRYHGISLRACPNYKNVIIPSLFYFLLPTMLGKGLIK